MGPLVTKQIILFATERAKHKADPKNYAQPHIGTGVGLAIGLFCLTVFASICQHQVSLVSLMRCGRRRGRTLVPDYFPFPSFICSVLLEVDVGRGIRSCWTQYLHLPAGDDPLSEGAEPPHQWKASQSS
jgi:hypothetical protein